MVPARKYFIMPTWDPCVRSIEWPQTNYPIWQIREEALVGLRDWWENLPALCDPEVLTA